MNDSAWSQTDFAPSATWENLRLRSRLLRRLRHFFHERGFWEVETPLLSADTVIDRHLDPLRVTFFDDPKRPECGRTMWLQTSPEFAMKRLMAAGADAIYQVTRAFRAGERGGLHNPEFTIVEWYRRGDGAQEAMSLLSDLADAMLPYGCADLYSYRDAFLDHVGLDPHTAAVDELRQAAQRHAVVVPADMPESDRDAWLEFLVGELVEPHLGKQRPTILYDYPASQAALARIRDDDPPVAERFELYVRGIELANGYHELIDPETLRRRAQAINAQRSADGKYVLPEQNRLLDAMESGLPPCAGVALGLDRLVMLAAGAETIDQVIAFPIDRA